jgi:hypothetical protein
MGLRRSLFFGLQSAGEFRELERSFMTEIQKVSTEGTRIGYIGNSCVIDCPPEDVGFYLDIMNWDFQISTWGGGWLSPFIFLLMQSFFNDRN